MSGRRVCGAVSVAVPDARAIADPRPRQIAHDIKNPLTPIKISVDLLRRARAESPERFAEMFEPTMELMERQIQNLRGISQDFYEFTGGRKSEPEVFDVAELIENNRANSNIQTQDGPTPIFFAAQTGRTSLVQYFIKKGADK